MGYETQEKVLLLLKQIHSIGMFWIVASSYYDTKLLRQRNEEQGLLIMATYEIQETEGIKWELVIASVYISSVLENRLQSFQKKSIAWLQIIFERKQQKAQRS